MVTILLDTNNHLPIRVDADAVPIFVLDLDELGDCSLFILPSVVDVILFFWWWLVMSDNHLSVPTSFNEFHRSHKEHKFRTNDEPLKFLEVHKQQKHCKKLLKVEKIP